MLKQTVAAIALAALLASCASGPPRTPRKVIERALATAPGAAQPGRIVATEVAFARAAREDGQWTAFREYIAPGGLLHGRNGPFEADPWLASQANPAQAIVWAPRSVWMSCDGSLAVSTGRSRDPEGLVGSFVTVWQRQPSGEDYRWIYDSGMPDDPQPPPPATPEDSDDTILVVADELIQGHVADCLPRGERPAALTPLSATPGARTGGGLSPDGTLDWRWEHRADGSRRFVARHYSEGEWREVLDWPRQAGAR
jgi:hypothetical protein